MSFLATFTHKKHLLAFALVFFMVPGVASAGLVTSTLWDIVVNVFGSFAGLGGLLLNYAILHYVTEGYEVELVSTINNLWVVTRDIFNITFIFGLLYIGFKMILDSENSNTKRWLISLILAALLINFSLYITKVVIDFTNILATQIVYSGAFPIKDGNVDISGAFMNSLGVQQLLGGGNLDPETIAGGGAYGYIFGAAILFIVVGFVFAAGGVLLIIRYAILIVYMVLSPLMFLGWVFPQLQGYTNKYWQGFLGKAFFAPIYILLIYFSYIVVKNVFATQIQSANYMNIFGQKADVVMGSFGTTLPPFILSCVFLIASLVIAQRLGAEGAATAVNLGRTISNRAKQVVQRTAANTARAGVAVAGKPIRRGSNVVGNSLERNLNRMQQKGGIIGSLSRSNLVEQSVRGTAAAAKNAKFGSANTLTQDNERRAATERNAQTRVTEAENKKKREAALVSYQTAAAMAANGNLTAQQRADAQKLRESSRGEIANSVRRISDTELTAMNKADLMQIAEHLSDKQLEAVEKSGKLSTFGSDSDMQKLKDARGKNTFKDYVEDLDNASSSAEHLGEAIKGIANTIKSISDERLTGMKADQLKDSRIAMHLSNDQIKALRTSGKYTADEIRSIETSRETGINDTITRGSAMDLSNNTAANNPANAAAFNNFKTEQRKSLFNRSVKEAGLLPVSAFTNPQAFEHITPAILEERLKNGASGKEKEIRKALMDHLRLPQRTTPIGGNLDPKSNPWAKWEQNSVHAAQFFA